MPVVETITPRYHSRLSQNTITVTANTAIQISGGLDANWPLTAVNSTFKPSFFRQGIKLTNIGTTIVYIGSDNTVSNTAYLGILAPASDTFIPGNGSLPVWLYSPTSNGSVVMEELQ